METVNNIGTLSVVRRKIHAANTAATRIKKRE